MVTLLDKEARTALSEAAKAFERAKRKGYAWLADDGTFGTWEGQMDFMPAPSPPGQLELFDLQW
jgi:hypothetical protein